MVKILYYSSKDSYERIEAIIVTTCPVSYTHLDVYKRQVPYMVVLSQYIMLQNEHSRCEYNWQPDIREVTW